MDIKKAEEHIIDSFSRNNEVIRQYLDDVTARVKKQSDALDEIASLTQPLTVARVAEAKDAVLDLTATWDELGRLSDLLAKHSPPSEQYGLGPFKARIVDQYNAGLDAYEKIKRWYEKISF
ncbi:hypothetical protein G3O06_10385 [Burkholderia sp. Ac-20345]|uniref:hypothetical protein n=1 Tax=Burkholderia sp. Ac-20345 TaxID=2703891 RepID=UPI00197B5C3D|nr:hypothetical protein [Burkholderia sp. Ac-20345]MBN3777959.1 hypothetical protein [Burkholderia sp. Ac-20345]